MRRAGLPTVKDRFVLIVIIAMAHHERLLRPDESLPPDLQLCQDLGECVELWTSRRTHIPDSTRHTMSKGQS